MVPLANLSNTVLAFNSEPCLGTNSVALIVVDAELILDRLHEVVVYLEAHTVVLQSVRPMQNMRLACMHEPITVLILAVLINIWLMLEKVSQIRRSLLQPSPRLHIDPF